MTTPAEFKAIKELRQIDDQGVSPDLLMLFESETESLKVLLSQLASYIRKPVEDELIPPGVPQYWPGDTPPNGFVFINNGLTFNTVTYPKLAIAWPTGVIPPHKGLVIECTADGSVAGGVEEGQVKSHQVNISIDEYSFGRVQTSADGAHIHEGVPLKLNDSDRGTGGDSLFSIDDPGETLQAGEHYHVMDLPDHKHQASGEHAGSARNTVDRINYNVMVRLA